MIHAYILLYILTGFTLGCFQYFRNKSKDVGAIAELAAVLMIWPILGIIYILSELFKAGKKG